MAWKCSVCGEDIHLKRIDGKNYPTKCPLEKYKFVKTFYTQEIKQLLGYSFDDDLLLSNDPESLRKFSEQIPVETPLTKYIKRGEGGVHTKSLVIKASVSTFFKHFNKVLIDIYDDNKIHFVDSNVDSNETQFNYLWLSPTVLRECYFREGLGNAKFKSMTELGLPNLAIYPMGNVMSVKHGAWGDIVLDLITHRQSLGKPTWIIKSTPWTNCAEMNSSENLRKFILNLPVVEIETEEEIKQADEIKQTEVVQQNSKSSDRHSYF